MDTQPVQINTKFNPGLIGVKFLLFILLLIPLVYYLKKPQSALKSITVGSAKVLVEIADNEPERSKGLSNRKFLEDDQGMLFLYNKPGRYSFWMKGMLFPLDFIFIKSGKIVNIATDIPNPKDKNEAPVILNNNQEFDWVLEVNAGFVQKNNIKIGDKVEGW